MVDRFYLPYARNAFTLATLAVLISACATAPEEDFSHARSAIIGGAFDATHEAVVLLATNNSICSGTIVKVDPATRVAWVLTAAHCVVPTPPVIAVQGSDFNDQTKAIRYPVLDAKAHPLYADGVFEHDVAVVRVLGADTSTPMIPVAGASDGLATGRTVLSVGYGRVTPSNQAIPPNAENTKRKSISKAISLLSPTLIRYAQGGGSGGICSGDSGGPVLTNAGGEKVVGVHSYVSGDCLVDGSSMRVSSELAFINGELNKAVPALTGCPRCLDTKASGNSECAQAERACLSDATCAKVIACYQPCRSLACQQACRDKFPQAAGSITKVAACGCRKACATECAGTLDTTCGGLPKCGITATDACGQCGEGACCTERLAASFDNVGHACLRDPAGASCAANASYMAYATCLSTRCAEACSETIPALEEPPPATDPAAGAAPSAADSGSGCATSSGAPSHRTGAIVLALGVFAFIFTRRRLWS
jgi:MYXO-CTERM domain-containing protein